MFGFAPLLRRLGANVGVTTMISVVCVVLYLVTLLVDPSQLFSGSIFSILGPSQPVLLAFGASGYLPVVELGRWWTLLTAGWLHGGLLHIVFNVMWLRQLGPQVTEIYGSGRTTIVFVLGSAVGFLFSTLGSLAPAPVAMVMGRGLFTIGASAGVLALLGAIYAWADRTGNRYATGRIWSMLAFLAVFGILVRGVDNWAHLGGFVGGWAIGRVLDPLKPERGDHLVVAIALLAVTVVAFGYNILTAFGFL